MKYAVGEVVLVIFPFSNLKGQKLRPALVLAQTEFGNYILCQITSKPYSSKSAIKLNIMDFSEKGLTIMSFVRPDKLFTAEPSIMEKTAGKLKARKLKIILLAVRNIFRV